MDITNPAIEDYIRSLLARHDEPVLLEMESEGKEKGFPIVGRMVGVVLEVLARSIGAKKVFELGSGYGYSGYWFSQRLGRTASSTSPTAIRKTRRRPRITFRGLDCGIR